jgi:hypothetical protein
MPVRRLLGTWLLLAVLMPVNGAVREFGLKRILPDALAEVASVVTGIAVILATTYVCFRIPRGTTNGRLALDALVLVLLTIAYEFTIGRLGGESWTDLFGHYAIWRGEWWPLVLVALASTPFLWRNVTSRSAPPPRPTPEAARRR